MQHFRRSEDGYVLIFSLLLLPVLFGFALLIIDVSRGNNAHGDLQAAADALAIAGGVELDGEPGAIAAAHAAMTEITNNVRMLPRNPSDAQISLPYTTGSSTDAFSVVFLDDIPDQDTQPIDTQWLTDHGTTDDALASYVFVHAQSQDLQPMFQRVLGLSGDVPIGAWAVAAYERAACEVVPIMICNPFENEGTEYSTLLNAFNQGRMHGRMLRMVASVEGGGEVGPGNWGYLRTTGGNGASVLADALAGGSDVCYSGSTVDTEPGSMQSVAAGFNTRFGIYNGSFNNEESTFPPDLNVRDYSHLVPPGNGASSPGDFKWANEEMSTPIGGTQGLIGDDYRWNLRGECRPVTPGAQPNDPPILGDIMFSGTINPDFKGAPPPDAFSIDFAAGTCSTTEIQDDGTTLTDTATWIPGYWEARHGTPWDNYLSDNSLTNSVIRRSYPDEEDFFTSDLPGDAFNPDNVLPSRFDIYNHELAQTPSLALAPSGGAAFAEYGRREIFMAVVNCDAVGDAGISLQGAATSVPVVTYATGFVLSRMGVQDAIDMEMTDLVGFVGSTALNEKFREESMLVR